MDKYDGITIGDLVSEQFIENLNVINSESINKLYDMKYRTDLTAQSPNVKNTDGTDNSKVYQIIAKPDLTNLSNNADIRNATSFNSIFGEKITAYRKSQLSDRFYFGYEAVEYTDTKVGTGAINLKGNTGFENLLSLETGTTISSSALIQTKRAMRTVATFEYGIDFIAIIKKPTGDGIAEISLKSDDANGLGIKCKKINNEQVFGFFYIKDGVENFVSQSEFNKDKIDGTGASGFNIDISKNNIYRLLAGYSVVAPSLFVMNEQNQWIHVHEFEYPNQNIDTCISTTFLTPTFYVSNGTTAENVEVQISAYNTFNIDGESVDVNNRKFSLGLTGTLDGTGGYIRRPIIGFQNSSTFQGTLMPTEKACKISAILEYLAVTLSGQNKTILFELLMLPITSITNTPTFDKVSVDSILDYTVDATYDYTDAKTIFSTSLQSTSDKIEPQVDRLRLSLNAGNIAVFTITSDTVLDIDWIFSNAWSELF